MKRYSAGKISLMGLLFALAMVFSYLENLVSIPGLLPGMRLGLSNLVTMYCLFFLGKSSGYTMAVLKAGFVVLTRGAVAGALSLSGGLLSVTAIVLLDCLSKHSLHYVTLSAVGAVFHNIGQLVVARFLTSVFLYYYIPVLLLTGLAVGIMTGKLFIWIIPYLPERYRTKLHRFEK
ncbi:MAG: Gx transporter family protein [Negativibacillus sp.]|nr:Gx transporter family protein [Negativibacillus sp.]